MKTHKYFFIITSLLGVALFTPNYSKAQVMDTICGMVFNDINGNGIKDQTEPGISGATVSIDSSNNYLTDGGGYYLAIVTTASSHKIELDVPSGWLLTYPSLPGYYTVNIEGEKTCGLDFGIQLASSSSSCVNFDNFTVPANNKQHAFDVYGNGHGGFLNNWRVTSGTPSLLASGDLSGVNAYSGNQYALLSVCDAGQNWSEGLSYLYNFANGQSYRVSMAALNSNGLGSATPLTVEYYLLPTSIAYSYNNNTGCSPTAAVPNGALLVHTENNFTQTSWQNLSFNTGILTGNYTQLWIRARFSAGGIQTTSYYCFDDLCIETISTQTSCYSFDDIQIPSNNSDHAFNIYGNGNTGFLQDWMVTSGTPSVFLANNTLGTSPYDGNQFALMAVCDAGATYSEGVSLQYSFNPGQAYSVSMAVKNVRPQNASPTPIEVEYYLLPGAINYTYNSNTGCSPTPSVPSGAQLVHKISNFAQNNWQVISFNIPNQSSNYSQLWIRLRFSSGTVQPTTYFCLDSVCITPTTLQTLCSSFDGTTVPSGNKNHAFNIYGNGNPGFLQDWVVTNGSPSIQTSGDLNGTNAYDGNQYAVLGVCDVGSNWSDGAALKYTFSPGQAYSVSNAIRNVPLSTTSPIDVEYYLLQSPINYTYSNIGCSVTPAVPSGALKVHEVTGFSLNNWQQETFTISNLSSTYNYLWIRLKFSSGSTQNTALFCFDAFCVEPFTPQTTCNSFDGTSVPSGNKNHAFNIYGNGNPGFLEDWIVTNGSPSIQSSGDLNGVNAFDGNQYAVLGVCDVASNWSDGAALNYSFLAGQSYSVSMAIRNAPISTTSAIDVEYYLLQTPIAYNYNSNTGCSVSPNVPAGALKVHEITGYTQNSWQQESFTITNLSSTYNYLWIRVKFSSGSTQPTAHFCFDAVCVNPVSLQTTCSSFDGTTVPSGNKNHAFNIYGNGNPGFLQDWVVTNGSPSIQTSGDLNGTNAFDGNQYAVLGVCDVGSNWSDGAALKYTFSPGQAYSVSNAIRNVPLSTTSPIDVEYYLLQSPINYTYSNIGCSVTPAVPSGALKVHEVTGFSLNNWQQETFTISNLSSTYNYLWIRLKFSSGSTQNTALFCFDAFCVSSQTVLSIDNAVKATTPTATLYQNSKNPFDTETQISCYIPEESKGTAAIEVFEVTGKLLSRTAITGTGAQSIMFDARELNAGIYLYSLVVNGQRIDTKRMMIAR